MSRDGAPVSDGLGDPVRRPSRLSFRTKAAAVYEEVSRQILDGTLEPGSTINQEGLAAALGVSVTPLREALNHLEAIGLVNLEAHRTMTVASLSVVEVRELYAVRLRLDPYAAAQAALGASASRLDMIDALASRATESTTQGRLKANREFHRAVYGACGNRTLADLLDRLWDRTDRYRLLALEDEQHERGAEREHHLIAAALRDRDAALTERLMSEHVEATLKLVERHADLR